MEEFRRLGKWWLPNKDAEFPGLLEYSKDGIFFEVVGALPMHDPEVIYGVSNGEKITLLNSVTTKLSTANSFLLPNQFIVGAHVSLSELEGKFKAFVKLTESNAWACQTGLSSEQKAEDGKPLWNIFYKRPESKTLCNDSNLKISFRPNIYWPPIPNYKTQNIIKEEVVYTIEMSVDNFQELFIPVDALRKFVSLGMRTSVEVESVRLKIGRIKLDLYYRQSEVKVDDKPGFRHQVNCLFTYSELNDPSEQFKKWYSIITNRPDVIELFFHKRGAQLYDQFLSKAQALKELACIIKSDAREWGFKSRISFLFNQFKDIMDLTGDKEKFSQLVLDNRDYYVHWLEKKKNKASDIHVLYQLWIDLNLLLEMCLLLIIGFEKSQIYNLIKKNHYYDQMLGLSSPNPARIRWE